MAQENVLLLESALKDLRESMLSSAPKIKYAEAKEKLEGFEEAKALYTLYGINMWEDNAQKALELCQKAADLGYAPAKYDLAQHYMYGDVVDKDMLRAMTLMEESGVQRYEDALEDLIYLYSSGRTVRENTGRLFFWEQIKDGCPLEELEPLLPLTDDIIRLDRKRRDAFVAFPEILSGGDKFSNIFKSVDQKYVINAPIDKSIIINAGPGRGKTYVITQRVNYLAKNGINPEQIAIMSFTNAVVNELKQRFANLEEDDDGNLAERSIRNVDPRTFHSMAYYYLKTANEYLSDEQWEKVDLDFNKFGYEDCMTKGAELIRNNENLLEGTEYLIIDEIQDINDAKAVFVITVIEQCKRLGIPFLLMGDSCQSIYDYLDEKGNNSSGVSMTSRKFYERILEIGKDYADMVSFSENYRQNTNLETIKPVVDIAEEIRQAILDEDSYLFKDKQLDMNKFIKTVSVDDIASILETHKGQTICLMERNNITVKMLSAELIKRKIKHKCALGAGKGLYPKWIAKVFGSIENEFVTRELLLTKVIAAGYDYSVSDKIWNALQKEVRQPSEILSFKNIIWALQSHALDNIIEEKKDEDNLIISNVHRSKGLEYDVVIMDKHFANRYEMKEDEQRVFYVAITRPKEELMYLDYKPFGSLKWPKSARGRVKHYSDKKIDYIQVKGDSNYSDIMPWGFRLEDMEKSQKIIGEMGPNDRIDIAYDKKKDLYAVVVKTTVVGYMRRKFTNDLKYYTNGKLPDFLENLYIDGVFTAIEQSGNSYEIFNYFTFSGMAKLIYTT